MFGRHHIEPGVIIAPSADVDHSPGDEKKVKEFIQLIWYAITLVCCIPIHGHFYSGLLLRGRICVHQPMRISRRTYVVPYYTICLFRCSVWILQRVIVTSPSKPLEYTPKGTPRRPVCLKLYASEIAALYKDEEDAASAATRQFPDRL